MTPHLHGGKIDQRNVTILVTEGDQAGIGVKRQADQIFLPS